MYLEQPEYLKAVSSCDGPTELVRMIILDIGGEKKRSDLNVDGTVDIKDPLYALGRFQW